MLQALRSSCAFGNRRHSAFAQEHEGNNQSDNQKRQDS